MGLRKFLGLGMDEDKESSDERRARLENEMEILRQQMERNGGVATMPSSIKYAVRSGASTRYEIYSHTFVFHMLGGGSREIVLEDNIVEYLQHMDLRTGHVTMDDGRVPEEFLAKLKMFYVTPFDCSNLLYTKGHVRAEQNEDMSRVITVNKDLVQFTEYGRKLLKIVNLANEMLVPL